jgi:hypothetical protein
MANNFVIQENLGPEFELGTTVANKMTIRVDGTTILRDAVTGELSVAPGAISTTNALSLAGALLTSTVNGEAATQDLTAAIQAAETVTTLGYNGATGDLTYVDEDGVTTTITLPLENFLSAASYDSGTNILTLTLTDGTTFPVNLADLIDTFALSGGDTTTVSGDGSTGSPWVVEAKIDPAPGNQLTASPTGLFVAETPATTNTLVNDGTNTLTSTVDGVADSADIVNTVVLAAGTPAGNLDTTVNGVTGTIAMVDTTDYEIQDLFGVPLARAYSLTGGGYD